MFQELKEKLIDSTDMSAILNDLIWQILDSLIQSYTDEAKRENSAELEESLQRIFDLSPPLRALRSGGLRVGSGP